MNHSRWGILIPMTAIIITVLLTYILAPDIIWDIAHHDEDETHDFPSYKDCAPSVCGNSTIRFPFGRCGALSAHCMDNQRIDLYDIKGQEFYGRVMGDITESSYSTRTLPIAQDIVYSSIFYWLIRGNFLRLSQAYTVGAIYNCTQPPRHIYKNVTWLDWGETDSHYLFYHDTDDKYIPGCTWYSLIVVPVDKNYNICADKNFEQLQKKGFQLTWEPSLDCM